MNGLRSAGMTVVITEWCHASTLRFVRITLASGCAAINSSAKTVGGRSVTEAQCPSRWSQSERVKGLPLWKYSASIASCHMVLSGRVAEYGEHVVDGALVELGERLVHGWKKRG